MSYNEYPLSKFPDQIDDIPRMEDIYADDVDLVNQYKSHVMNKNITAANELLENNPQLKSKIFNAFKVNSLADAIHATQKFFNENVQGFVEQKQIEMEQYIDERQSMLEEEQNQLIINAGESNAEIVQARVDADAYGYESLKARLDTENANIKSQLAEKASIEYVGDLTSNIANGTPKGTYSTLNDLQLAFPNGDENNYLVQEDGHIYYWNGTLWQDTGIQYQSTGIADDSITNTQTKFFTSDNLYDYNKVEFNSLLSGSGIPTSSSSYDVTDFIPVESSAIYTAGRRIRNAYFYDLSKSYSSTITTSGQSIPYTFNSPGDGFVRFSLYKDSTETFTFTKSDKVSGIGRRLKFPQGFVESIDEVAIKNESVRPEKTSFIKTGKNLFNKDKRVLDGLPNVEGGITFTTSSDTTDWIPIEVGKTIAYNLAKSYVVYGLDKLYIEEEVFSSNAGTGTYTPKHDGFIRFGISKENIDLFQVELGNSNTYLESYKLTMENLSFTQKQLNELRKIQDSSKNLEITKTNTNLLIKSSLDSENEIIISAGIDIYKNNLFNFLETRLNGELIHQTGDDITPIRTFYTVGANHGYGVIQITASGKTVSDLGSQWTDGERTFTLIRVEGDVLIFACPYTVTDGVTSATISLPVSDLTHVSGATNIDTVLVSGATITQLYPSVKDVNTEFYVDSQELTSDSTVIGEELQIKESYGIIDYKSLIDWTQDNIGLDYRNHLDLIDSVAKMGITYQFTESAKCVIHHNLIALKKFNTGKCGFLQSGPLDESKGTLYDYVPNVLSKSGYDFKNLIDMTNYNTGINYYSSDYKDTQIPPHRYVSWLKDGTTKKIGFTMGYIIDKSDSKHSERLLNTDVAFDKRGTKKNYPIALNNKILNPGDYFNFIGYRNYLSPGIKSTNITEVEVGNNLYLYIDYHENATFENIPLKEHIGKSITVLEKNIDFTIHNEVVDNEGVLFSVNNNYGYAIFKIA